MAKRGQLIMGAKKQLRHIRAADRILRSLPAVFRNPAREKIKMRASYRRVIFDLHKGVFINFTPRDTETDCC